MFGKITNAVSFCAIQHLGLPQLRALTTLRVKSSDLSWGIHYKKLLAKAYSTLRLLRRTFCGNIPPVCKRKLYVSLIHSHFYPCSPIWRLHFIKDVLERIQRRATKYIIGKTSQNYKDRLISLNMLPLMYQLELNDIIFFLSCLKNPEYQYPLMDQFSFASCSTQSASCFKLNLTRSLSSVHYHSFVCRFLRLWNALPPIDLSLSIYALKVINFQQHFVNHFDPLVLGTFHYLCPCHNCSKILRTRLD